MLPGSPQFFKRSLPLHRFLGFARLCARDDESVKDVVEQQLRITPLIGENGLRVAGELDLGVAQALHDALSVLVDGGADVALDLRDVSFIDSECLAVIVRAAMALGESGTLVLAEPSRVVIRLLTLTEIVKIVPNLLVHESAPYRRVTDG